MIVRHTLVVCPDYRVAMSGERPSLLSAEASKGGFGVALSQNDSSSVEQPIACASRATLQNESNWGITDLDSEAGATVCQEASSHALGDTLSDEPCLVTEL